MKILSWVLFLALMIGVVACNGGGTTSEVAPMPTAEPAQTGQEAAPAAETEKIILMSHDSFNASEEVIAAFEEANHVKVEFLRSGDAGAAINQAILSKENPLADVFFGVDNTFFSRALEAGIFESYDSPLLANVPEEFKLDPENRLLPVDYGDVCLNYDKGWFSERGLAPPGNIEDLVKEEYAGLTVVENPATSSPGLAFLMTTIDHFGEAGYLDYWEQLVANDVLVVNGWNEAYYEAFTRYEGTRPIVVSYASSPPAEVYYAEEPLTEAPTASVIGDKSCFRQIEFIGILTGTPRRAMAEKLVDFLLSQEFQEDIPLTMFVFPVNQEAQLPEVFDKYAEVAPNPSTLPPEEIAEKREAWINAWTETVLR
jgi:thiamine transport system substrate-binding protein